MNPHYNLKCELEAQPRRIILIILVSALISWIEYLIRPIFTWKEPLAVFLYTFFLWQGNAFFSGLTIKWFPTIEQTMMRIVTNLVFAVFYTVFIVALVEMLLYSFDRSFSASLIDFIIGFMVTLIISLIFQTGAYFNLWRDSIKEREQLKRARMESELKVLNNQVNPHFLFNSLNTLMSLIPDDSNLALEYTHRFAEVYRYVLQSRDHELVSLRSELEFCHNYSFLLQIRYGEQFRLNENIDSDDLDLQVPPLVIQMLIENATKHNAINQQSHLEIDLKSLGNHQLMIVNNRNIRFRPADGTGTGLENIHKRYQFFTQEKVLVKSTESHFKVIIPLIKVAKYEGSYS